MTHSDDIARIEIKHLRDLLKNANEDNKNLRSIIQRSRYRNTKQRDLLKNANEDNKNLRSINLTLQATVDMYLQKQELEYRNSKL
jgi:lysophospholipase L1-like esterase